VQEQVAPDVDRRLVAALEAGPGGYRLTLADGAAISARRVVVAAGIELFANRPAVSDGLPSELASHTGDHQDFRRFRGSRVLVVGGGQSALEYAALLHESGAHAEVAVRQDQLHWLNGGKYQRMPGWWQCLICSGGCRDGLRTGSATGLSARRAPLGCRRG
jgi:cation diffusion facilitator CzcD-associated flavoprotein CzcO